MHVLHDLIAYGQRGRSVPCRYLSLPKSKLWNPKTPLWRPGEELYAIPPRNQRCLRTSSPDRFARAAPGFRCVFSLPHERGHQCLFPSRTSGLLRSSHYETGCNESGTNDIVRPYAVLVAQSQTGVRAPKQAYESREVSPDRLDGRFFHEIPEILRLQQ